MNTQHLKYVVEVEKTGSITKAAHNLYMGQPNLSKAIKELENELGITIFKRTAKGVEPTRKGAEFLIYAKTILTQIDELESLYRPHNDKSVSLNISAPRASYISAAFSDFLNRYASEDHLNVNYHETSGVGVINDVSNGESKLGIVRYQTIYESYFSGLIQENHLHSQPLWEFGLSVLLSENHPLAVYEDIPYHLLSRYTEIVHGDVQAPPLSLSKIQKQSRLDTPHKSIAVYDRGIQFDLLERVNNTFMWVSPMPKEVLSSKHLILRSCSSVSSAYQDVFVYDPSRPLNRHEASFAEYLKDIVKSGGLCGQ